MMPVLGYEYRGYVYLLSWFADILLLKKHVRIQMLPCFKGLSYLKICIEKCTCSRRDVQQRVDRRSMQMVLTPYDLFSWNKQNVNSIQ
jgi:hypothetical protein